MIVHMSRHFEIWRHAARACGNIGWSMGRSKVDMSLVKELRASSGAPIIDCLKALSDENVKGDIDEAFAWLRRHGKSKASSLQSRHAGDGVVSIQVNGRRGLIIEVNSETDFVARNSKFQEFVRDVAQTAFENLSLAAKEDTHENIDIDELLSFKTKNRNLNVKDMLDETIAAVRENISIKKASHLCMKSDGVVSGYVHGSLSPGSNVGRAASLVGIQYLGNDSNIDHCLHEVGKLLAMHCVASKPLYLSRQSVPQSVIESEKEILKNQLGGSDKTDEIINHTIEGRMNKYFREHVLLEQLHMVVEGSPKVEKYLSDLTNKFNGRVEVRAFARYSIDS